MFVASSAIPKADSNANGAAAKAPAETSSLPPVAPGSANPVQEGAGVNDETVPVDADGKRLSKVREALVLVMPFFMYHRGRERERESHGKMDREVCRRKYDRSSSLQPFTE